MLRGDTLVKDIFEGRIKGEEAKWKMQNTRLDEEKRRRHISEFERDDTVSIYMEKLVHKTCPWAKNLKRDNYSVLS